MADVEEIEIKLKVDDSEVKKALSDKTPVSEKSMGVGGKGKQAGTMGGGMIGNATKGVNMAKGAAMNPMGFVQNMFGESGMIGKQLMKFLPKMLVKAIPIVGWAFMAVEIVPIIIKEVVKQLTSVGAPFDKRWKRNVKQEVNAFFSREEQQRRRLGLDPVIMTTVVGFKNNGGLRTVNTLNQVREEGISSIGLTMKAQGVQP